MAANTVPVFTNAAVIGAGVTPLTGAPGLGGSGSGSVVPSPTPATVLTAGANGSRIEEITVMPLGTTGNVIATTLVNIFLYDGTTYWLHDQIYVSGYTVSATVLATRWSKVYQNLVIPSGWTLCASVTVTQVVPFVVEALGGSY